MMKNDQNAENTAKLTSKEHRVQPDEAPHAPSDAPQERGGPKGPEPTRFGDWESGGRCTDF